MDISRSIKRISLHHRTLLVLFLASVTVVLFWQSISHEFINYDDPSYVTDNIHVRTGLTYPNILWAFTTLKLSNWHPLTWLSHMLDSEIYGLNPEGHHMTNILFHMANTLLLFHLLYSTTRRYWQSIFVAALFALHPLHVESVAWIAERKDLLSTFFGFVTLILYGRYAKNPRALAYVATLIAFVAGLMAKPMLVTLPFVMLLWDFWPLARFQFKKKRVDDDLHDLHTNYPPSTPLRLVLEKIPFFALMLASSIVTYFAQYKGGAVADVQLTPLLFRIINALLSYVRYISNTFWPKNLAAIYPLPPTLTLMHGIVAGLMLLGVSYLVYRLAHLHPSLLTGWLWYLGTLVPVVGLVQVGEQAMADRYTYIPLVGIFVMVSWGVPALLQSWRYRRALLAALTLLTLAALTMCTRVQLSYWKNGVMLFDHATRAVANNHIAYRLLGEALGQQGRFVEADRSFQEALRIQPDYEHGHMAWGVVLAKQKKIDEAMNHFTTVLRMNPGSADAHFNLGIMLVEKGKFEEAIDHYLEALKIQPGREDVHANVAAVYMEQGKIQEALFHYQEALRADPRNGEANYNLGLAFAVLGNLEESIRYFSTAIRLNPNLAEAHCNLGIALVRAGRLDEGIYHFNKALQVNPDFTEARRTLEAAMKLKARLSPSK